MSFFQKISLISIMFFTVVFHHRVECSMPLSQANLLPAIPSLMKFDSETKQILTVFAMQVLYIAMVVYIQLKMLEAPGFKVYQPGEVKENFSNIAGNDEAKELFMDIVEYLKNPEIYKAIGAKPTTGVLLTGGPGTGKTLLARALAGEANCAFIYASGSEMNGKFVGSGVERIQKLFSQAKSQYTWMLKKIPCIIFIDEFEILAKQRGSSFDNYSDQTVNELLTQLDGFVKRQDTPVIVIAATNYPDKIDKALIRPGRLDRTIHIHAPDFQDRYGVLEIHLHKVLHADDIDLSSIAQQTIGFSGAELEGIINSAARLAVNRGSLMVCQQDLQEAYELRVIGVASKRGLTAQEKEIIAYHEAGHALSCMLLMPDRVVNKITILPRGESLGVTHMLQLNEITRLYSKEQYLNNIAVLLAGRAAEDIVFNVITTGPSDDLRRATELAENMIRYYGMGDSLVVVGCCKKIETSDIAKILDEQYQRVKGILQNKIDSLSSLANKLLEKDTLVEEEIKGLRLL